MSEYGYTCPHCGFIHLEEDFKKSDTINCVECRKEIVKDKCEKPHVWVEEKA